MNSQFRDVKPLVTNVFSSNSQLSHLIILLPRKCLNFRLLNIRQHVKTTTEAQNFYLTFTKYYIHFLFRKTSTIVQLINYGAVFPGATERPGSGRLTGSAADAGAGAFGANR